MTRITALTCLLLSIIRANSSLLAWEYPRVEYRPEEARLASGEVISGNVIHLDPDWNLTLQQADRKHQINAAELVSWGRKREPRRGTLVITTCGQLLVSDWRKTDEAISISESGSFLLRPCAVPADQLRGVIAQLPSSSRLADRLSDDLSRRRLEQDEFLLLNGDVLRGVWLASADEERLRLKTARALVTVAKERIQAVRPATSRGAAELDHDQRYAILGFRDGSQLDVAALRVRGETIELRCRGGWNLEADATAFWAELCFVQPRHAGISYLSELTPTSYQHIPFLTQSWAYAFNRSAAGGALRYRDSILSEGVGMHGTSKLTFDLKGDFRRFRAAVALDDTTGTSGSVIFRVMIDRGDQQWKTAWASPIVRGGDAAYHVDVDLRDARRLQLEVDEAERGDEWDHANWLDACLLK